MPSNAGTGEASKDLANLLAEVRDFAGSLIGSGGGFPPFGAVVDAGGKIGLVVFQASAGQTGQQVIGRLTQTIRDRALKENLRAGGVAYMVSFEVDSKPMTAIMASLQHKSGSPQEVIIPFTRAGKSVQFGQQVVRPGELAIY